MESVTVGDTLADKIFYIWKVLNFYWIRKYTQKNQLPSFSRLDAPAHSLF